MEIKDIIIAPLQVACDITNKCNMRCLHCYNESGENNYICDELSDKEFLKLIDDVCEIGAFNFCFCGGEPLLRKDLLLKSVKKLRDANVPNISMVTNGLLMTDELAKELIDSGVNNIQYSLDGSTAETHERLRNMKGSFHKTLNAIKILNRLGFKPGIAFTPTSFNIHQFKELCEMLNGEYQVKEVRTQPLMPMGRGDNNQKSIQATVIQYRQLVKDIQEIKGRGYTFRVDYGDPVSHLIIYTNVNTSHTDIMIRANGNIVPSAYLPLVVGNIRNNSIIEYWNQGLNDIWSKGIVRNIASNIKCISDMNKEITGIPKIWKDSDIYIDMISNNLNDISILENGEAIEYV